VTDQPFPIPGYFLGDADDEWLHIDPIDGRVPIGVTISTGYRGRRIEPGYAEEVIAVIRRGCGLDTAPDRLDLGPILADHYVATTDPATADRGMLCPATDRAAARARIVDRHVLSLLAEVTMLRGDLAAAENDAEPEDDDPITRAALAETIVAADAERDRLEAELTAARAAVDAWIEDANNGLGADPGDLMHALEKARVTR